MSISETDAVSRDGAGHAHSVRGPNRPHGLRQWVEVVSPILQASLAVIVVVTLALSASVALTVANFDRALQTIVDSRFEYIAKELKGDIEKGLDLGLALKEFSNAQQIIDQPLSRNDDLVRVEITNNDGKILFSAQKSVDTGQQERRREVSTALINPFGQEAGTVTVVYATGGALNAVEDVAFRLTRAAGVIAVIAAAGAAAACMLVLRRIPRSLLRAKEALAQRSAPSAPHDQIERTSAEAVVVSKATLDDLGAILVEGPSRGKRESG